jgi:hypothetical protein
MTADQRLNQVIRESCITLIILVRLLQQKPLALRPAETNPSDKRV